MTLIALIKELVNPVFGNTRVAYEYLPRYRCVIINYTINNVYRSTKTTPGLGQNLLVEQFDLVRYQNVGTNTLHL